MADLGDRAQVMLITAFVLAVSFLAVAVMLNSVIYTENLATRGEDARGSEAVQFRADAVAGTERLIEYANDNETNLTDIHSELNSTVRAMNNGTVPIQAVDGLATEITLEDTTNGTRIAQFNSSRNFTSAKVSDTWELAENIISTRSFRINITDMSSLSNLATSGNFTVLVDDSTTWKLEIYKRNSTTTVLAINGNEACVSGPAPEIDLTAGTIDGERCEALVFGEGVSPAYEIEFENSNKIQGNFSLVVNSTGVDEDNYNNNEDSPFSEDAIYAATIHVFHESASHLYETDARVIPGESDD